MKDLLLTVEATAEILEVHTRTVRRYIKEKKLKAQKVGGRWKISLEQLREFMNYDSIDQVINHKVTDPDIRVYDNQNKPKITVSAVVDIFVKSKDEAFRLSSTIMAAMNNRTREEKARCDYLFNEDAGLARFMFWGSPTFMSTIMKMIEVIN